MPNTLVRSKQTQIFTHLQKALLNAVDDCSGHDSLTIVDATLSAIAALANEALSGAGCKLSNSSDRRNEKMTQLCALLDFVRMPAVRKALECAPAEVQNGISDLAIDLQVAAFAGAATA